MAQSWYADLGPLKDKNIGTERLLYAEEQAIGLCVFGFSQKR